MKRCIITLGILLITISSASASVVTFENVPGATTYGAPGPLPTGYEGFNWDFWWYGKDWATHDYAGSYYDRGIVSGNYAAVGLQGNEITSSSLFNFEGAYLTALLDRWDETNKCSITIKGYKDGVMVYDTTVFLTNDANWIALNWSNVDRITFSDVSRGAPYAVDDFTFNRSTSAVPIPGTVWLFAPALAGLVGFRRKFLV